MRACACTKKRKGGGETSQVTVRKAAAGVYAATNDGKVRWEGEPGQGGPGVEGV